MNRIESHVYFLRYLSVATSYQRRHLLQTATAEQLNILYEIAFNILQGNISLTDEDYTILYKHRNVFRKLSLKEVDHFTKKQLLGKHSCAIRDLMQIFFHYYSSKNTEITSSFLPYTEFGDHSEEEEEAEEEEEEEEQEEKLEEEEKKGERQEFINTFDENARTEWIQNLHTDTSVALPTAAEAIPESKYEQSTESTETETQEII